MKTLAKICLYCFILVNINLAGQNSLPSSADHSQEMPSPFNQLPQGTCCVACATAMALNWHYRDEKIIFSPSYLYNPLVQEANAGLAIGYVLKFCQEFGCTGTEYFPFVPDDYSLLPAASAMESGLPYKITWQYTNNVTEAKKWLSEEVIVGYFSTGHAVCYVGYNDDKIIGTDTGAFRFINSYGSGWGENGYGWLSYKTAAKNALSFYKISKKKEEAPLLAIYADIENARQICLKKSRKFSWISEDQSDTLAQISNEIFSGRMMPHASFPATKLIIELEYEGVPRNDSADFPIAAPSAKEISLKGQALSFLEKTSRSWDTKIEIRYVKDTIIINDTAYSILKKIEIKHFYPILKHAITINLLPDGIEDYERNNFRIWPNPAGSKINFSCSEPEKIKIFSLSGQEIISLTAQAGNNEIDISGLSKGMYIFLNGKKTTKFIVR